MSWRFTHATGAFVVGTLLFLGVRGSVHGAAVMSAVVEAHDVSKRFLLHHNARSS